MKKRNWLMTIAFAVLSLTIISTCVIGSTYAKFTSKVSANAGVKAAGFMVGSTGTDTATIEAATAVTAPGESKMASIGFNYYSQVTTEFTVDGAGTGYTLTGTGVFAEEKYEALLNGFNAWLTAKQAKGEFTGVDAETVKTAKATLDDWFTVTFTSDAAGQKPIGGTGMNEAFAAAVRAAATAQSVTLKTNETGNKVGAMPDNATKALEIKDSFYAKITWATTNSADDNAWDTYVGEKVAEGNTAEVTSWSGITVALSVTASQVVA